MIDEGVGLQRRCRQYYRVLAGSRQAVGWGSMNRRSWMFEERRLTRRWMTWWQRWIVRPWPARRFCASFMATARENSRHR